MLEMSEMRTRECVHKKLLCECEHEFCKRKWSLLCIERNQQFNGNKDWGKQWDHGQNSGLHGLLQSLNALPRHTELWDARSIVVPPRRIRIEIETYKHDDYNGDHESDGRVDLDLEYEDSLCEHLFTQATFRLYKQIRVDCQQAPHENLNLKRLTYSETKSKIDSWGKSLFGIPSLGRDVNRYSIQIMQCADPADQVRRLLAFLEPVMSLQTQEERFEKYQEAWAKISPNVKNIVWGASMGVNFPWDGKERLWKTLRREIEGKFQTALNEHLNGESTDRPIQPFSFMDYSQMLFGLLDIFWKGLDGYIAIQDHITAVSADMDAYDEDERPMSVKRMHWSARSTAQDFLDVILFMHAVPQRATDRWDALDLESDVTWFHEHCEVYQKNEELMAFLRDCAVVVLITGCFSLTQEVKSIHDAYMAWHA